MKQLALLILSALLGVLNVCSRPDAASVPEPTPPLFKFGTNVTPDGQTFQVDGKGFIDNGQYVLPVMGEIHYCRVPESEWKREVLKMKAGGIDIVACYVFWNYHEPEEGKFVWEGNLNLRKFLEICKECNQKVVLRIGPFCHGEAYLGGIPEWMVDKSIADRANYALRTTAPGFVAGVSEMYKQIGLQAKGLLWKDGGPVIGAQIDNESRGPWPYLAALKQAAVEAGLDLPFYTRTGWPRMNGSAVFGELLPLYGDYADGFWDRSLRDMPGSYRQAFHFTDSRLSAVIATEVFGTNQSTEMDREDWAYPYLTCELGGGMMPSYYRRIHIFDKDALGLAICKVGSGSNLPGYYMYHGGINPYCPDHSMGELQASKYTNSNDLPYMSYDYQSPLGEVGQPNGSFHYLRLLHQMLREWGGGLSRMDPVFHDDDVVRWTERRNGDSGFIFVNNYERLATLGDKTWRCFDRDLTVKDGVSFCFPFGLKFQKLTIDFATAQPFCKLRDAVYFVAVEGITPEISINGKVYTVQPGEEVVVRKVHFKVLSLEEAFRAYKVSDDRIAFSDGILYEDNGQILEEKWIEERRLVPVQTAAAGPLRTIPNGAAGLPEQPVQSDFDAAAVWNLQLDRLEHPEDYFLEVNFRGDVARVYSGGQMIQDNFWNGRPMYVRVSDIVDGQVELRILPMPKDIPVYLQAGQKAVLEAFAGDSMLALDDVRLLHRTTQPFE
ncbi:MAG: beta-galactosidase [Bacteroidales bacterium]|nr:beta-galactosidase [Bacteroidales bacterium]